MSIEAMKQAINMLVTLTSYLDRDAPLYVVDKADKCLDALCEAIEQAEKNDFNPDWDAVGVLFEENQRLLAELSQAKKDNEVKTVHRGMSARGVTVHWDETVNGCAPPQREWVSLTRAEMLGIADRNTHIEEGGGHYMKVLAMLTEADKMLREKNAHGWQSVENVTEYLDDLRGGADE